MEQAVPTIRVMQFKTEFRRNKQTKEPEAIDWVEYAPVHSMQNTRIWSRVDHMRPPEQPFEHDDEGDRMAFIRHRWEMIEKAYKAWKNEEEFPVDGTPLGMWPGINPDQADAFRKVGILTIEDVATMPDALMSKIPMPNVRTLKTAAGVFLDATDRAAVADEVADQREKIANLQEQLSAAMELIGKGDTAPAAAKRGKAKAKSEDPGEQSEEAAEPAEEAA